MTGKTAFRLRSRTAGVLGSVALLAAAAAVSGLATFGNFSDSASATTAVQSGVLSLDVGVPGGIRHVIPAAVEGMTPGYSLTRPVNLINDGGVALSSLRLATTATPANALGTDPVNGLQLTLEHCSRRWVEGGTDADPTYTCDQTRRLLYSGPLLSSAQLPSPSSLVPGGVDNLVFTISLPTTAGSHFQGLHANVSLAFTGVQVPGTAR